MIENYQYSGVLRESYAILCKVTRSFDFPINFDRQTKYK